MKLSEAIMMNGMTKPQGFGSDSISDKYAPCAMGGALQAIGRQRKDVIDCYTEFREAWPWTAGRIKHPCPLCKPSSLCNTQLDIIWHLNDTHKWTRAQIAEWVATVEPREEISPKDELILCDQPVEGTR